MPLLVALQLIALVTIPMIACIRFRSAKDTKVVRVINSFVLPNLVRVKCELPFLCCSFCSQLCCFCTPSKRWCCLLLQTIPIVKALIAVGETVILLHPTLPLAGVSIGIKRGCHQNDSLADG